MLRVLVWLSLIADAWAFVSLHHDAQSRSYARKVVASRRDEGESFQSRIPLWLAQSSDVSSSSRASPKQLIAQGMSEFRQGRVLDSLTYFDQAKTVAPWIAPYLWQRGISLYYDGQYQQASQQFRTDVQVNPYDTEEIVWDIASQCMALRRGSVDSKVVFPLNPQQVLTLPDTNRDPRRIMVRICLVLFDGTRYVGIF